MGSMKGMGVGLQHRCAGHAAWGVLYYSNPGSILLCSSQDPMCWMKCEDLVQSENPVTPSFFFLSFPFFF